MGINKNIRKVFVFLCWLLISSGALVLLIAAINIKNRETCKGVEIDITGVEEFFFLDKEDVMNTITTSGMGKPEGKPVASFRLQTLEEALRRNVWVRDAELYFDNNMVLHVNIFEREPVARIFTNSGRSFYIDSSAHTMPLSDKMHVRIPVFTGFPSDNLRPTTTDVKLMRLVKNIALEISHSEFFKAQIAQVDITPSGNFEMIPVVGNHIIEFGDGENAEGKFKRLFLFYHQVLANTGFDRYSRINVQFEKQVIGTRRAYTGKIDSLQAVKNIQKLIEASKEITTDSVFTFVDKNVSMLKKADSTLSVNIAPALPDAGAVTSKPGKDLSPTIHPIKKYSSQHPLKRPETDPSNIRDKPKPKAVMPRIE